MRKLSTNIVRLGLAALTCLLLKTAFAEVVVYDLQQIGPVDEDHTRSDNGYRYNEVLFTSDSGQAAGSATQYFDLPGQVIYGKSVWVFNGTETVIVGLLSDEYVVDGDNYSISVLQEFNNSGQAAGTSQIFTTGYSIRGHAAWIYDGVSTGRIGLTDSDHTGNSDGFQHSSVQLLNNTGQAAGWAKRYGLSNGSSNGQSVWLYRGAGKAKRIGLTTSEHTYLEAQNSYLDAMNDAGQVIGRSSRYGAGGRGLGISAWLHTGNTSTNIGIIDADYTRDSDGYQVSSPVALNEAGQVIGESSWYGSGDSARITAWLYDNGGRTFLGLTDDEHTHSGVGSSRVELLNNAGQVVGRSTRYDILGQPQDSTLWFFDGSAHVPIGLTAADNTNSSGSRAQTPIAINDAGFVAGRSRRYSPEGTGLSNNGWSAWLFDGNATVDTGLTDTRHTLPSNGARESTIVGMNAAGQVIGSSQRYTSGTTGNALVGLTAWLWEGGEQILLNGLATESANGFKYSRPVFVNENGDVLGIYWYYPDGGYEPADREIRVFRYTHVDGMADVGLKINEDFDSWEALDEHLGMNSDSSLFGNGINSNGQMAYKASSVPVIPAVVDVEPNDDSNEVFPSSNREIDVGVMTSAELDAQQIDASKIRFGVGDAVITSPAQLEELDGNQIGPDLRVRFYTEESGIRCNDTEVTLIGETYAGDVFAGTDTIDAADCETTSSCHP